MTAQLCRYLRLRILLAAAILLGSTVAGGAATVSTAIVLNIESSKFIPASDYEILRRAYQDALFTAPVDGSIGIAVLQFSTDVEEVVPFTVLDSEATLRRVRSTIGAMTQLGGESNIAAAITRSTAILTGSTPGCGPGGIRCLIDVSFLTMQSVPGDPKGASAAAIAAGVHQINCTGVTFGAICNDFIAGPDPVVTFAQTFADFDTALTTKFELEGLIPQQVAPVPLPPSTLLLAGGLSGLAVLRRRRGAETRS